MYFPTAKEIEVLKLFLSKASIKKEDIPQNIVTAVDGCIKKDFITEINKAFYLSDLGKRQF